MHKNDPEKIGQLLRNAKTIAVVGLTDSPMRPSFGVSEYMQAHGYRIIPVNPNITAWLGHKAYASLLDVPEKIDIVDVFRRSEAGPGSGGAGDSSQSASDMVAGGRDSRAGGKGRAEDAGIFVVMDLCILKEHRNRR